MDWSDDLAEWVYGPPGEEDDEPLSVGEEYRIAEEEERIRWIPGYRETVEDYLAELRKWHAAWRPGLDYPPEPERVKELRARISEWQKERAVAPWERAAS